MLNNLLRGKSKEDLISIIRTHEVKIKEYDDAIEECVGDDVSNNELYVKLLEIKDK